MPSLGTRSQDAVSAAISRARPSWRARTRWCAAPSTPTSSPTRRSRWPSAPAASPPSCADADRRRAARRGRSVRCRRDLSGPGFLNLTLTDARVWDQVVRTAREPTGSASAPPEDGRRTVVDYSAPEHRQGDARRAPAHHDHRRLPGPGPRVPRRRGDPAEPPRRLGHPVRDAHPVPRRAPRRLLAPRRARRRHLHRVRARRAVQGRPRGRSTPTPPSPTAPGPRGRALQAGDERHPRALAGDRRRVRVRVPRDLRPARRAAHPGGLRRRVVLQPLLADIVAELVDAGIAVDSDGALCVFSDEVTGPDGATRAADGPQERRRLRLRHHRPRHHPLPYPGPEGRPAALRRRLPPGPALPARSSRPPGAPAGSPTTSRPTHVAYGTVLGPDGRPFKTRSGGTVRLMDLLDAAVDRRPRRRRREGPRPRPGANSTRSPSRPASARSSTPTCPPPGSRTTPSTSSRMVVLHRQHRRLPPVRPHPDPLDPAQGRRPTTVTIDPTVPLHPAERALVLALDAFGATLADVGDDPRTAPALRLPLRPRQGLHRLLRNVPTFSPPTDPSAPTASPSASSPPAPSATASACSASPHPTACKHGHIGITALISCTLLHPGRSWAKSPSTPPTSPAPTPAVGRGAHPDGPARVVAVLLVVARVQRRRAARET